MAIVNPEVGTLRPAATNRTAASTCTACKGIHPAESFETIRRGGKSRRRRICHECLARVDALLEQSAATSLIVAVVGVTKETVADRRLELEARRSAASVPASMRQCSACETTYLVVRFQTRSDSSGKIVTRKVCEFCIDAVDRLLSERKAVSDITASTRVPEPTVRNRRRALGLPAQRRRLRPEEIEQILAMGRRDAEPAEIARSIGTDVVNVRRHLNDAGLRVPAVRRPLTPERLNQARLLLEDGAPYAEAFRTTGIDVKTLGERFPGYGKNSEHRALVARINNDDRLRKMQEEISRIRL